MTNIEPITATIPAELAGKRLDQALAALFPDYSRSRLKQWILAGQVLVDGNTRRPRDAVAEGEVLRVSPILKQEVSHHPEPIPLEILHEDEHILVLNKQAGQVVHPAAGHHCGTLLNALLHHAPVLENIPRAGIVHRLDKDTSGLMVVAKSLTAQKYLVEQMQARDITREYLAVTVAVMTAGGTVDAPIGRHPRQRKQMAVTEKGKHAISHYRVIERFAAHSLIRVKLETGRTHQIRVHMAHINYPLLGDPVYGGRLRIPPGSSEDFANILRGFRRQALHATRLLLRHPGSNEEISWEVSVPEDMAHLLEALREDFRARDQ